MTQKRNLATAALLLTALSVHAQPPMYVCTTSGCDAFDMALMPSAVFAGDSIRIGHQPAYHVQQIDSIVFRRPQGEVHELGWWGSMTDGTACYRARLEQPDYQYDACYTFHVEAGICTSAECELYFAEQWMMLQFGEMPTDTDTNAAFRWRMAHRGQHAHDELQRMAGRQDDVGSAANRGGMGAPAGHGDRTAKRP